MNNINLAVIGFNKHISREFIGELLKEKLNLNKIYYFSEDDFKDPVISPLKDVELVEYSMENIRSKSLTFAVITGACDNQEELIDELTSDGAVVITPSVTVNEMEKFPLINIDINKDDLIEHGGVILTPSSITMLISPVAKLAREQYGLDRIVGTVVYSKDDVCKNSSVTDSDDNTLLENQIITEIRSLINEPNLALAFTTIPTDSTLTMASLNVSVDNDFIISDIPMFGNKYDNIIKSNPGENGILDLEKLKEKNMEKMFISRVREDHSVEHGFSLMLSSFNLPHIEVSNKVRILSELVSQYERLSR